MSILTFDHYAIRTARFEECRAFYCECLGLVEGPRPPLSVEGVWLYSGSAALVHIVDVSAAGAPENKSDVRGRRPGFVDHVAFRATGLDETRQNLVRMGARFRESAIPSLHLHQLFVEDPDGVVIELNFVVDASAAKGQQST